MAAELIGITSTVPAEIIFASGNTPVDLNNVFISSDDPVEMIKVAEKAGFPVNYCAWIKGIYGALKSNPGIKKVIGVCQGDCGNTTALTDLLGHEGYEIIPFAYPAEADVNAISEELDWLAFRLGADMAEVERRNAQIMETRRLAEKVDVMTWRDNKVSGEENHKALVNMSDFQGDSAAYADRLRQLIKQAEERKPFDKGIRLGLAGVPPIVTDLYSGIEQSGGRIVYNEVQYEFAMTGTESGLAERYTAYTYPYGAVMRAQKIRQEIAKRSIKGLIHYVQSFCYHQLDDIVIRETVGVPVLRLEADKPGPMDSRTAVRLEAFMETLT